MTLAIWLCPVEKDPERQIVEVISLGWRYAEHLINIEMMGGQEVAEEYFLLQTNVRDKMNWFHQQNSPDDIVGYDREVAAVLTRLLPQATKKFYQGKHPDADLEQY